ncbi:MAG: hypothetical protein WC975_07350 [Phycisphaerae bacterium]
MNCRNGLVLMVGIGMGNFGCATVDKTAELTIREVVRPVIDKVAAEAATRNFQLQGQGSAINPGLVVDGYLVFGTGAVYQFRIKSDGLSANMAGATQGDQGPDLSHTTTTQPAEK